MIRSMKRSALDQLTRDFHLTEPAAAVALDLTGARPDAAAWRAMTVHLSSAAGIAALGAGVIFFVAANWQDYGVIGRFAFLQAAFLACVGYALWRPPPRPSGQAALVLATLVTGTMLALFGQSYQTGADVHELFFTWALLALPFALAGASGALWATLWVIVNVAFALYFGWLNQGRLMPWWPWEGGIDRSVSLFVACLADFAGAALFHYVGRTRFAAHAPTWLARMLATFAFLFGTAACITAMSTKSPGVVAAFGVLSVAIGVATLREKRDVFPLALIAASWIAISTAFIVHGIEGGNELGIVFMIALWLIATSTAAGFLLMRWERAWKAKG